MNRRFLFLTCLARAALKHLRAGNLGELTVEISEEAARAWRFAKPSDEERGLEMQQLKQASPGEIMAIAHQISEEIGAGLPLHERERLAYFLSQAAMQASTNGGQASNVTQAAVPGAAEQSVDVIFTVASTPPRRLTPGDQPIAGADLRLLRLLGAGGCGEVWLAHDPDLPERKVALKFCLNLDEAARRKFLEREKKVHAYLQAHGGGRGVVELCRSYLKNELPCLEYEYVEGGNLAALMCERAGGMASREAALTTLQLAEIVGQIHRFDPPLVHRDLKPANVLVQRNNGQTLLKIADFGIGALANPHDAACDHDPEKTEPLGGQSVLRGDSIRGWHSPLYASPEQIRGEPPDPRDDVHALGIIWYQMLLGDLSAGPPTGLDWSEELARRQMTDAQVKLLVSCFSRPERRPENAAALADEIKRLFDSRSDLEDDDDEIDIIGTKAGQQRDDNTLGMKLCWCPSGDFWMGSPATERGRSNDEAQIFVRLSVGFWLGKHVVTQGEWDQVMRANGSFFNREGGGRNSVRGLEISRLPVESVSWLGAREFCRRLTDLERLEGRLPEDWEYQLPTEAQWEYACRAGTATPYSCGEGLSPAHANYNNHLRRTTEVGAYDPNAWGLCDMHGNVSEWCLDEYQGRLPGGRDPRIEGESGARRVCRGGNWNNGALLCRSAARSQNPPGARSSLIGFRVALVKVKAKTE